MARRTPGGFHEAGIMAAGSNAIGAATGLSTRLILTSRHMRFYTSRMIKKQYAVIGLALFVAFAFLPVSGEDAALTNEDIVRLSQAGLGAEVIIIKIKASETNFDTSVEQLLVLKGAGVEDSIIAVMVNPGTAAPTAADEDTDSDESFIITYPTPGTTPAARSGSAAQSAPAPQAAAPSAPAVVAPAPRAPGSSFRDKLSAGGQGPEMVVIPSGRFRMGDLSGEGSDNEQPVHEVVIARPFALSKYEITFEDYDKFTYPNKVDDQSWGRGRRPVLNVSWDDANEYAAWLSAQTGKRYRLPTEAEWEYAARAGSTTKYHFGNDESQLCRYANHLDISVPDEHLILNRNETCSDGVGERTAVVGSYQPNNFGLYDMYGNVIEWVQDCWNVGYVGAPTDGSAWTSGECSRRVLRGGSWNDGPRNLRSADRIWDPRSTRTNFLGFRLAQDL